jgi:hypothetical protein
MSTKKQRYKAFVCDKNSHRVVLTIEISSDGYLTALDDARKLCEANHPNCYIGQVITL